MSTLSTAIRATHLVTNAAWFGGSLFGAVGLNPAARRAGSTREQVDMSGEGWERWGPVQGAAIGLHLLSGLGILADNKNRTMRHRPTREAVVVKTVLTGAALASTAGAYVFGERLGQLRGSDTDAKGEIAATPSGREEQARTAERQLAWLQWATPAATGALLVLDAYLGEQQRGPAGLLDRRR